MEENEKVEENNQLNNEETPKKIEVVTGDGNLTISPVHEHLEVEKPKPKENRTIFVPEVKGDNSQTTNNSNEN